MLWPWRMSSWASMSSALKASVLTALLVLSAHKRCTEEGEERFAVRFHTVQRDGLLLPDNLRCKVENIAQEIEISFQHLRLGNSNPVVVIIV